MKILNLTQHVTTPEQVEQGVYEPKDKAKVQELLTFEELPTWEELYHRAKELVQIALDEGYDMVMIGGAPYLMGVLDAEFAEVGIHAVYAFSKRESVDVHQPDGSIKKTMVFRHAGFVQNYEA